MPRPTKFKTVCSLPKRNCFIPENQLADEIGTVDMSVEEYETIRLIDYEGFTQEECCKYMNVARTTVQQIYNHARKKIAKTIVEGLSLKIRGGNYKLCDGKEQYCGCGGCQKHNRRNTKN